MGSKMKKLLLCALVCVGFLIAKDNTNDEYGANDYLKDWTDEDIEFYEQGGESIETAIYFCNQGSGVAHYGLPVCQALKSFKEFMLYVEAKNKAKTKSVVREICFWAMKMSEAELLQLGNFRDKDNSPLMVPSEARKFLKNCAKSK